MSRSACHRRPHVLVCASVPIGCALCGCIIGRFAASAHSTPPPQNSVTRVAQAGYPLAISPDPIAMGVIAAGRPADSAFVVRNDCSAPVTLERAVTSCPCI
jgi:hypothetical protein